MERNLDFSNSVSVNCMLDVYKDIENLKCECGGKFFPTGPVLLKSPDFAAPNVQYQMMIIHCVDCGCELNRIYAIDTSSKEFVDEQNRAYADIPRWHKHDRGNIINDDEE